MEGKNEFELIVAQGRRPLWMLIIAACFFTLMLYRLYEICLFFYNYGLCTYAFVFVAFILKAAILALAAGITWSCTKTILIDTDEDLLISRFCVGPFSKDVKSKVPQLEYVSVFFDSKERFQVNLWYVKNRHYNMYFFDQKEIAMEFAAKVAIKLNIDLLDATEKGNSKWLDKTEL